MAVKNNEIYVINQPKSIILSLIVIDLDLVKELPEKIHNALVKLRDYSDLFFIFTQDHKKIDKIKFTSLYRGCGFIISPGNNLGRSIFKIMEYDLEIFNDLKKHLAITISRISDLNDIVNKDLEKLTLMTGSIGRPVFRNRILKSEELHDIYTIPEELKPVEESKNVFKTIIGMIKHKKEIQLETDGVGMFNTWHSNSPVMYFPKPIIEQFVEKDSINFENWVDTFTTSDPRYMFSSLINLMNIKILDLDFWEVKL